jgi:hypothetical protein
MFDKDDFDTTLERRESGNDGDVFITIQNLFTKEWIKQ